MNKNVFLYTAALLFTIQSSVCGQLLSTEGLDTAIVYKSIESALKNPEKVYVLDLKKAKLITFPPELFSFHNLQRLTLSKNKLDSIPDEISQLTWLQEVYLDKNQLTHFPEGITKLKHLRRLILNQNKITTLPSSIGNLSKLAYLDLWNTEISSVPDSMKELKSLKELDLRVIYFSATEKDRIVDLLPNTKVHFSHMCDCGP